MLPCFCSLSRLRKRFEDFFCEYSYLHIFLHVSICTRKLGHNPFCISLPLPSTMKRGTVKTLCFIMLPCAFIYIWIASIAIVRERDTSDSSRMRIVPASNDFSDIYSISATVCIPSPPSLPYSHNRPISFIPSVTLRRQPAVTRRNQRPRRPCRQRSEPMR